MSDFSTCEWRDLGLDPWRLVADDWMLITAGSLESWNTMTASWGGFGHLWNRDVAFVFVRPTRHTYSFMENSEGFTLSFFAQEQRKILSICGSCSGRDTDKAAAAGIKPRLFAVGEEGAGGEGGPGRVAFEEARLVLSCRKLHAQNLDPAGFLDPSIDANYPAKDWHRFYVGAIEGAWRRDLSSND